MPAERSHQSVMLAESVDAWLGEAGQKVGALFVDGTFGCGGHTRELLRRVGPDARVLAFDKDPHAVAQAMQIGDSRFSISHGSFCQIEGLPASSVDGVLLDLGMSSAQVDDPSRGFSFLRDGPLDGRMDCTSGPTVAQWLVQADAQEIEEVIHDYGEERFARPIAKAIATHCRAQGEIRSTLELARIVAGVVRTRERGQNPATRTFQAFRIHINRELEDLRNALDATLRVLRPGGRLAVLSFHSLEDRIVKRFIARHSREEVDPRLPPVLARVVLPLRQLGRMRPSPQEVAGNPRARSAMLRVAQRIPESGKK
ncbi:16S rRNA (cytosine(1402)-N(4))-methyltransferase RsmH [Candidatus Symbiobacter mobilis]|uniref:Ribosomal RNA small subunit methyltransferase H n=1 Tax=Candidatus Symbiobacter mobilis CR TaxID=946483 RepID=U5N9T1_9BURK|nr:16S rRNA (cytosine(1402)-N(4))-methyltransferase RsmH [Candidatus Symbiobacter mobilis]AGX86998.1 S-adenosyl-methyltransferase [Candidatus Symbiobacter mobilis CR]